MDVLFSQRARSDMVAIGEYVGAQNQRDALHMVHTMVDTLLTRWWIHFSHGCLVTRIAGDRGA